MSAVVADSCASYGGGRSRQLCDQLRGFGVDILRFNGADEQWSNECGYVALWRAIQLARDVHANLPPLTAKDLIPVVDDMELEASLTPERARAIRQGMTGGVAIMLTTWEVSEYCERKGLGFADSLHRFWAQILTGTGPFSAQRSNVIFVQGEQGNCGHFFTVLLNNVGPLAGPNPIPHLPDVEIVDADETDSDTDDLDHSPPTPTTPAAGRSNPRKANLATPSRSAATHTNSP